jgi:hypothetical protein
MSETYKMYNGSVELLFDDAKHRYTVDGKTVDGVTSILGIINKPALVYWSANKAAEYINLNLPVGKPMDEIEKKALVDGCKTAHRTLKEAAGGSGTMLHDAIEAYAKEKKLPNFVNPILKKSFEQFLNWVTENEVSFLASEKKIYSQKYNYAGTLDLILKIKDKIVLADIKTSSGIWNEQFLQCSAYKAAIQEEYPDKKIDHVAIIRCGKDGEFEVKEANDFEENFQAFLGALSLYRRIKKMDFDKKKTKGAA